MILAYDCEDYTKNKESGKFEPILDATGKHFILGCTVKESGKKKTFYDRKEMWKYILEQGRKEVQRGKRLLCYSHNAKYDFYQIADLHDRNLRWFSEDPFIAGYYMEVERIFDTPEKLESWKLWAKKRGIRYQEYGGFLVKYWKEAIKFLDTISIFRMSLKKVGETIGFPKEEMPLELGKKLKKKDLKILAKYCQNDCMVIIKALEYMKKKLRENGLSIRTICTINQIAISYVISELRKGNNEHLLIKGNNGRLSEFTHKTKFAEEIHSAYRGGSMRVWKTGFIEKVNDIDFNSLYPYCAMNIRMPDLRTERKIEKPLEEFEVNELLSEIGISRVMIKNVSNDIGLLQIRGGDKSYVPLIGKTMIGTWTHIELEEALRSGYEIIDIEWSVIWKEGENPFKEIFSKVYQKRLESETEFEKYFYKMIMNGSIGKFGQTRTNQEILVDSVERVYEYMEKNYKIIKGISGSTDLMYVNKEIGKKDVKKYYAPIIPALITAKSRVEMHKYYKRVPKGKLIYSDTDSIIWEGNKDDLSLFEIGEKIGQFKVEKDIETGEPLIETKAIIWGTKTKAIGNNIAIAGIFKSDLKMDDFKEGKVISKRMMGMKNAREENIGKFIIETRDLKEQLKQFKESEREMGVLPLYIDKGIEDVSFFNEYLKVIPLVDTETQ